MAVRPTAQLLSGLSIGASIPVSAMTSTGAITSALGVDLDGLTLIPKSLDVIKNIFEKSRAGTPVLRVDDLVAMRIELRNCSVVPGSPPLIKKTGTGKGLLILHFPPQTITEETFYEPPPPDISDPKDVDPDHPSHHSKPKPEPSDASADELLREPPIRARSADESRLVFEVLADSKIEYSLAGILQAVQDLKLVVAGNAKPRAKKPGLILPIKDLLNQVAINTLSIKKRAALSAHVAASFRMVARGASDVSTLRARQAISNTDVLTNIPDNVGVGIGTVLQPVNGPEPKNPTPSQTSIEMPWRLILSPHAGAAWRHTTEPAYSQATDRTELWHTRMVVPRSDGSHIRPPYPDPNRTIRAIWARSGTGLEAATPPMQREYPGANDLPNPSTVPFRQPLDDFDRFQIVHLSSNFGADNYHPEPIDTKSMMLSSLGGWLDSRGAWDPVGLSVEEWVHRAAMARDHYAKVVYRGFLCPFGHRVSLVKVTERKFHKDTDGVAPDLSQNAYLRQRFFIVVREHVRHFDDSAFQATGSIDGSVNYARQFPFAKVEILTDQTPDLDDPKHTEVILDKKQLFFWPYVGTNPFKFQCVATDLDDRRITFELPMIFMDNTIACPRNLLNKKLVPDWTTAQNYAADAASEYNTSFLHNVDLDLQQLSLATPANPGDSAVEARSVTLNMESPVRPSAGVNAVANQSLRAYSNQLTRPLFVPKVFQVEAKLGPVAHLTGSAKTNKLQWNAQYLRVGFNTNTAAAEADRNIGEVFADIVQTGSNMGQLDFSSQGDKSGGFLQPNIKPLALSRIAGPIMSDPMEFAKGIQEAGAGFPTAPSINDLPLPLLFGCIPLGELIKAVADISGEPEKIPKFASEAGTQVETFISTLLRLFSLAIDLPKGPLGVAKGALEQHFAKIEDLIQQGQVVPQEMQQAIDKLNEMLSLVEALRLKIEAAANVVVDDIGTDANFVNALADIPTLKTRIIELLAIVNGPQGNLIPANIRQQIIAFANGLDTVLEAIKDAEAVFDAGKEVFEKLNDIVGDPSDLADLFEDPTDFGIKLNALGTAVGMFRTAIADFDLLPEAVRMPIVSAFDEVEDVLVIAGQLSEILGALTGDELTIRFDWNPEIANWPDTSTPLFRANDKKGLVVAVEGKVKKNGASSPQISVSCSLRSFDLVLIAPASFIELNFDKISFAIDSAAKMDVDVVLSDIKFVGPLSFVETLRDLIPLDGFSDPPYLDITTEGIHAGFDIALPTVAVGVLNISNLSLGAGFTVPFIGQPLSVGFNFCTREQPFCLTVYCFGGGGFFGITIDPQGVQILEAAFEFGASLSVDFGVASGGVEVMAGIYFRMEQDDASLTGYFRLGGHVNVLGLISASLELYLELEYEFSSGKCTGRASLTIEVSVLFFSGSVTIKCEKKFAGSNGDPSLREMMGHQPDLPLEQELVAISGPDVDYGWREYAEAFA
ncbi:hypothetical protein [Roseovarius aestuarii]|uniref:Uncharacterized protein n=2 Tax=Roseovarius aestuarii TaxID=475083 RepID=A0A1X7BWQ0_9RHOB|nr:hypothetical protein [Roseovarius aestuarii]SMC14066.1 hypothetical protein ROA7745_03930 [Roseovarius aestuarii]